MNIKWADGWDARRMMRYKYWGFKGSSAHTRNRLYLGAVVERKDQNGPVIPCTPAAVHLAVEPTMGWVRFPNGNRWDHRPRRSFWLVVMDADEAVVHSPSHPEFSKVAGKRYTVVARVTYTKQHVYPQSRGQFVQQLERLT